MRLFSVISLLLFFQLQVTSQNYCRVMFYNTGNLFDAVDDSLTDDEEFLPDGTRRWTDTRYHMKLNAIARVIVAAGGWQLPEVVGLCEIENKRVAYDLTHNGLLADGGYSFIHYESPDPRGIDVCLLYLPDKVRILKHENWVPVYPDGSPLYSRSILFVKSLINTDTIDFIVCHLPSKRDGIMASAEKRDLMTCYLATRTDSLFRHSGGNETVILMGDFNVTPDDAAAEKICRQGRLVNLTKPLSDRGYGSFRYKGRWEMIDQILVSETLMNDITSGPEGCTPDVRIQDFDFLLEDDPDYPGKRPFSTYREYKWKGGFSDHLPVVLTLCL